MISIALLLAAAHAAPPAGSAAPAPVAVAPVKAPAAPAVGKGPLTTASGLRIETLAAGTGARPEEGGAVLLTYEGKLSNGTVFDSAKEPTGLPVSGLVPGFTEALLMMNTGGSYRIWLPPELAYGAEGAGGGAIPPNSPLEFTVTIVDVASPAMLEAAARAQSEPQPQAPAQPVR